MPSFSVTDICNRALQKVGAARITAISDATPSARACNAMYDSLRQRLYAEYPWKFAIKRTQVTADGTAPAFGKAASFTLPADFIALVPPDQDFNYDAIDWLIEGDKLLADTTDELNLRYIGDITTVSSMHPLFREALSCLMAQELAEVLTQSNSKKAYSSDDFKDVIMRARQSNAFLGTAQRHPDTSFVTVRDEP